MYIVKDDSQMTQRCLWRCIFARVCVRCIYSHASWSSSHLPLNHEGHWGTTDDFATSYLGDSGLCCCVLRLSSAVISLCLLILHRCSMSHSVSNDRNCLTRFLSIVWFCVCVCVCACVCFQLKCCGGDGPMDYEISNWKSAQPDRQGIAPASCCKDYFRYQDVSRVCHIWETTPGTEQDLSANIQRKVGWEFSWWMRLVGLHRKLWWLVVAFPGVWGFWVNVWQVIPHLCFFFF